ncbi:MAG: hypothetical protein WAT79_11820 [Saprospiraceae bacterium]
MLKFLIVTIGLIGTISCNKETNKDKCEDCVINTYKCDKEGGEIRWKTNGENEVVSAGYFSANQGGPTQTQQHFDFAGNFESCGGDFSGSTDLSIKKFGVGLFSFYYTVLYTKDFCGEKTLLSSSKSDDYLEITRYDGKTADGKFLLQEKTGGATQCKPDVWMAEGTFSNIPVY